jgi:IS1 family transposase/transposase-like protein
MLCPLCDQEGVRYGRNRNGSQRWCCRACHHTFSDIPAPQPRLFADRQLTVEKAVTAIRLLVEGNSIRSVCRLSGMGKPTLLGLLLRSGEGCKRLMAERVRNIPCTSVQCDELWSFVWCKEKTRLRKQYRYEEIGDCYTWTAIEPKSKLLLAYAVGKRDHSTAFRFLRNLRDATLGISQIDTDGLGIYRSVIPLVFGRRQSHAQIIKIFATPQNEETRYSPPQIVETRIEVGSGNPDMDAACTSHVERSNLTIRMLLRRFTRLTNGHSKSWRHHEAAIALLFAYYNFCRPHMTLTEREDRPTTPAMAAGLTDHVWSVAELLEKVIPRGSEAIAS